MFRIPAPTGWYQSQDITTCTCRYRDWNDPIHDAVISNHIGHRAPTPRLYTPQDRRVADSSEMLVPAFSLHAAGNPFRTAACIGSVANGFPEITVIEFSGSPLLSSGFDHSVSRHGGPAATDTKSGSQRLRILRRSSRVMAPELRSRSQAVAAAHTRFCSRNH